MEWSGKNSGLGGSSIGSNGDSCCDGAFAIEFPGVTGWLKPFAWGRYGWKCDNRIDCTSKRKASGKVKEGWDQHPIHYYRRSRCCVSVNSYSSSGSSWFNPANSSSSSAPLCVVGFHRLKRFWKILLLIGTLGSSLSWSIEGRIVCLAISVNVSNEL